MGAGEGCEKCNKKKQTLQRRASHGEEPSSVPPIVNEVLRSPGEPLDVTTRTFFERRLGHDFGKVRVHADAQAAESARLVNALAYAVGHHVVFGASRHEPPTRSGLQLLAHELTHVVQQRDSAEPSSLRLGTTSDPCEKEAESVAGAALSGSAIAKVSERPAVIARQPAAPAPIPDQQTMQNAEVRRSGMLLFALSKLADLTTAVRGGKGNDPAFAPTAAAVTHWLNVPLGDPTFLPTVEKAEGIIGKSLNAKTKIVRSPESNADCRGHPYAVSNIGIPQLNIRCCDAFFAAGQECQADIMAHEYFHLVGLHHGEAPGRSTARAAMNAAQALNSADNMAQLVSEIARGTTDACPAGR